jgi:hypothetical protein
VGITGAGTSNPCQRVSADACPMVSQCDLSAIAGWPVGTGSVQQGHPTSSARTTRRVGDHISSRMRGSTTGLFARPGCPGAGARVAVLVSAARGGPTHYRHQANASARSHDEGRFWWRLLLLASCEPRDDSVFPAGTKRVRQLGNERARASLTRPSLVMKGSPVRVRASAYNKVPAESLSLQRPAQSASRGPTARLLRRRSD